MSVIIILLLPLVATAARLHSVQKVWASGVTVVSCAGDFDFSARVAWQVAAGNSVTADLSDPAC